MPRRDSNICINRHHFNTLLLILQRSRKEISRGSTGSRILRSLSLIITPCYYFVCIWHFWSIRVLNFKILLNLWKTTNQARIPSRRFLSVLLLYIKHQWSTRDTLFESYDILVIKRNQIVKYFLISSVGTQLWRLYPVGICTSQIPEICPTLRCIVNNNARVCSYLLQLQ